MKNDLFPQFVYYIFNSYSIPVIYYNQYKPIEFREDSKDYNVEDGEEGDWGEIRYYSLDTNELCAIYTNYGGDIDEYKFTAKGKEILKPVWDEWILNVFNNTKND